jgi:hypothetical protein
MSTHIAGNLTRLPSCARLPGRPSGDIRRSITFRAVLGEDRSQVPSAKPNCGENATGPEGSSDRAEYVAFATAEQCVDALMMFVWE